MAKHDSLLHAHQHHNARSGAASRIRPGSRGEWHGARAGPPDRMATINTMAPSTHRGRYCKGLVRKSNTSATTAAVAMCATWLRPPELSTMAVCAGLPFTTNVPLIAAAAFAAAQAGQVRVLVQRSDGCGRRRCGRWRRSAQRSSQSTILPREPASPLHASSHRHAQMGQAAGYRPKDGDAVRRKVPDRAGRDGPGHGDQRARDSRRNAAESQDARHHCGGEPSDGKWTSGRWRKTSASCKTVRRE